MARYPQQLCETICRGLAKHKRLDAKGLDPVGEVQINAIGEYDPNMNVQLHEEDGVETVKVQPDFELIAFDFVSNPSTQGAFMAPAAMNEGKENKEAAQCKMYCKVEHIISDILTGE